MIISRSSYNPTISEDGGPPDVYNSYKARTQVMGFLEIYIGLLYGCSPYNCPPRSFLESSACIVLLETKASTI